MSRPQRMISSNEVETVVAQGEVIEDYPNDPRGHSCLMLGFGEGGRVVRRVFAEGRIFGYNYGISSRSCSMVGRLSTKAIEYGMYSLQRAHEARYGSF
jgi:hypothetical protein